MLLPVGVVWIFLFWSGNGIGADSDAGSSKSVWGYRCVDDRCTKTSFSEDYPADKGISLAACRYFCGAGNGLLWPLPTGDYKYDNKLIHIDPGHIQFTWNTEFRLQNALWEANEKRFHDQVIAKTQGTELSRGGRKALISIRVVRESLEFNYKTDESYRVKIAGGEKVSDAVTIDIAANSFFGARHGLETVAQLIIYDDIRNELQIIGSVDLSDSPVYPHRGLVLDTSRNYITVPAIKRMLDAMAMVKMNVFHWHITDSQSFPMIIKSHPTLHTYGAYSPREVYTHESITDIVHYALIRGIRVIPELDAPSHVGEGWDRLNVTSCFKYQPWNDCCVEPPCGQLDPTKDAVYSILQDVYQEMNSLFTTADMFHMGGDEVSLKCWNMSEPIQQWMKQRGWGVDEKDFMKLRDYFQSEALKRLDRTLPEGEKRPIVLWTSKLTNSPYLEQYLDKERYLIQVWTTGVDPQIANLLEKGYRLIMSNYDALYLDCGFAGWVTDGNNWCGPYIGWQKVYNNNIMAMGGAYAKQIVGAEAALWTEQADSHSLDTRLWPRVSALAERLWANPRTGWEAADSRMLVHRERLVENGIGADSLQPKWCMQNEANCPISGGHWP